MSSFVPPPPASAGGSGRTRAVGRAASTGFLPPWAPHWEQRERPGTMAVPQLSHLALAGAASAAGRVGSSTIVPSPIDASVADSA